MPTERLDIEIAEQGLRQTRRAFAELVGDAQDVGAAMEDSADRFEASARRMEVALQKMQQQITTSAAGIKEAYAGASKEVEALTGNLSEVSASGGETVSVDVQAEGGSGFADTLQAIQQYVVSSKVFEMAEAINGLNDAFEEGKQAADTVRGAYDRFDRSAKEASERAERFGISVRESAQDLGILQRDTNAAEVDLGELRASMQKTGDEAQEMGEDARKASAQFQDLDAEAGSVDTNMQADVGGGGSGLLGLGVAGNALDNAIEGWRDYQEEVRSAYDRVEDLKGQLSDVYNNGGAENPRGQVQINKLKNELRDARAEAKGLGGDMEDGAGDAGDALSMLKGKASRLTAALSRLGPGAVAAAAATTIAAIGAAAVYTAYKMSQLTRRVSQYAQQIQVAQAQSGMAAEEIQTLFLRMKAFDSQVQFDQARDALKEFTIRLTEAKNKGGEALEGFKLLGFSVQELQSMTNAEVWTTYKKRLREASTATAVTAAEMTAGGEAGEKMALSFRQSEEDAAALNRQLEDLIIPEEDLERLAQVERGFTLLGKEVEAMSYSLATDFAPVLTEWILPGAFALVDVMKEMGTVIRKEILPELVIVGYLIENMDAMAGTGGIAGVLGNFTRLLKVYREQIPALSDDYADAEQRARALTDAMSQIPDRPRPFEERGHADAELVDADRPELDTNFFELLGSGGIQDMGFLGLTQTIDSIQDAEDALQVLQDAYNNATTQEARDQLKAYTQVVQDLQKQMEEGGPVTVDMSLIPEKLDDVKPKVKEQADALGALIAEGIGQSLGKGISQIADETFGALFGIGDKDALAGLRLQQYTLQEQERQLRESLRRREISQREYRLRVNVLNQQMLAQQQEIAAANGDIGASFRALGDTIGQIMKKVLADIAAMVAKLVIAKALISAFNLTSGGGGIGTSIVGALGGGGMIPKSTTASSKAMAGPAMKQATVKHVFEGQWELDGRSFKTGMDQTSVYDKRNGRSRNGR